MSGEIWFRDLQRKLEQNGWIHDRTQGSHFIFTGPNRPTLSIPVRRGKCKPSYGRMVDKAIEALK